MWVVEAIKIIVATGLISLLASVLLGVIIGLGFLIVYSLRKKPKCAISDCTQEVDIVWKPCCSMVHHQIWEQQEKEKAQTQIL